MNGLARLSMIVVAGLALCAVAAWADQPPTPPAVSQPVMPPAANQAAPASGVAAKPAPNKIGQVMLQTLSAQTLLVLPVRGSYDQHGAAISQLMGYVMPKGILRGAPRGLYYDDPEKVPADSLVWEVGAPVPAETKAEPPFVIRQLPEMQAAVVMCTGPYETTAPCYAVLTTWLQKNGYGLNGAVQEQWLSDPSVPPEKRQALIVYPVRKLP
jgi:AraC family transcriptional regulator